MCHCASYGKQEEIGADLIDKITPISILKYLSPTDFFSGHYKVSHSMQAYHLGCMCILVRM